MGRRKGITSSRYTQLKEAPWLYLQVPRKVPISKNYLPFFNLFFRVSERTDYYYHGFLFDKKIKRVLYLNCYFCKTQVPYYSEVFGACSVKGRSQNFTRIYGGYCNGCSKAFILVSRWSVKPKPGAV